MPILTKVSSQKKDDKRVNIFIDDKFSFGINRSLWAGYKLKIGTEISSELLEKLKKENEDSKVFDRILNFLSYRPRSEKEVRDKLNTITHSSEELIQQVIKKLKKYDYVDDSTFGKWWIEQRKKRAKGKRVVYQELLVKGLQKDLIEKLLEKEETAGIDEAVKVLIKNRWRFKGDEFKKKKKMQEMLLRRGFDWEEVKEAVQVFLTDGL